MINHHIVIYKKKLYAVELDERMRHIKNTCWEYSCKITDALGNEFLGYIISDRGIFVFDETLEIQKPCHICGNIEKQNGVSCEICDDWKMD